MAQIGAGLEGCGGLGRKTVIIILSLVLYFSVFHGLAMNAEATLQLRFSLRRTFFCVSAVLEIESASHASALSFLISFFFEVLLCFNLCKRIHFIFSVRPTLNITERTFRMTFYMSFHNFYVPEAASKAEANRRGTKSS